MHEDHAAMTSNVIIFLKLNTYLLLVLSINYIYIVPSSPPTGLSVAIVSASVLLVSWNPASDITGYITNYIPNGQPKLLVGKDILSDVIEGLTQGTIYNISLYSYKDLPSTLSSGISVLIDG